MVVAKGYKQTEVGVIPEDWEVNTIGFFTNVCTGGTPSTFVREYWNGDIRWMNSGELNLKRVFEVENRITELGLSNSATKLIPINSILIGLAGQGKTRGTVAINKVELCINQSIAVIFPCKELDYNYLFFNLDSRYSELRGLSTGDGGRGGLNLNIIKNLIIPIPPTITEQTAIANALSDMDVLIAQTEKLIEKKKAIKQGVMQELLKPKAGWVTKLLSELVVYKNGKAHENCVVENGDYVIVNSKFISTNGQVVKHTNENLCPVEKDEILMVLSDIPNGKAIAKCFIVNENNKFTLNQRICSLQAINIHPKFLYYLVNRNKYFLAFDDGVKQTNLRNEDVLKCPITYPQDYEMQEKFALVINEIELTLELLITKLQKLKNQKQGMMQALLTGKIRLV